MMKRKSVDTSSSAILNPDEYPDLVVLEDDIDDRGHPDDLFFEPLVVPFVSSEQTETGRVLHDFASIVDACVSWQFGGVSGGVEKDTFVAYALSNGLIPRVNVADFGDIADRVEVVSSDSEELYAIHSVRYEGDQVGLEFFIHILSTELDRGSEGDASMVSEVGGPLLLLGLVACGSRWAEDMGLI